MNRVFLYAGRSLVAISGVLLLTGFLTLFYTPADRSIVRKNEVTLYQNGYTETVGRLGYGKNDGGKTSFVFFGYEYHVEGKVYKGGWVKIGSGKSLDQLNTVYYNPYIPFLSALERGVPLFWVVLLGIVGLGVLEVRKWLLQFVRP